MLDRERIGASNLARELLSLALVNPDQCPERLPELVERYRLRDEDAAIFCVVHEFIAKNPNATTTSIIQKFRNARFASKFGEALAGAEAVLSRDDVARRQNVNVDFFLRSREWSVMRMRALERDGGRCCACGRTARDGVQINVDHIKPRIRFPELALTLDNLQVLCAPCNQGKGNRFETNWRDG